MAQEPARQQRRRPNHPGDGVDPNRTSRPSGATTTRARPTTPASETYRGTGPNSEPETQALEAPSARVGFEFLVNYHSAAELLLYGTGWQVSTPTPDDVIYEAMAGDDANLGVPGDPDISAELYTTNVHRHAHDAVVRHPWVHAGDGDL